MIFNIQHVANWEFIRQNIHCCIDNNNKAKNAKCQAKLYKKGDLVLLCRGTENKYKLLYQGPFSILKAYDNNTVHLKVRTLKDTYNIRKLKLITSAPTKNNYL